MILYVLAGLFTVGGILMAFGLFLPSTLLFAVCALIGLALAWETADQRDAYQRNHR